MLLSPVIPVKPVVGRRKPAIIPWIKRIGIGTIQTIVAQVHIQVAIMVIIKKYGLRGIARVRQTIFRGLFFKREVMLIYKKKIPRTLQKIFPKDTDINIVIAIV